MAGSIYVVPLRLPFENWPPGRREAERRPWSRGLTVGRTPGWTREARSGPRERRIRTWYIAKFPMRRTTFCGKNRAMNAQNHPRIVVDPSICDGEPTVRGTHFAVADILRLLEDGDTEEALVADFPPLTVADI